MKKIKTSIYLPPDLFWKLKELSVAKRLQNDNAAMEQAVQEWVDRELAATRPKAAPKSKQA